MTPAKPSARPKTNIWPSGILIDEHGRILDRDLNHLSSENLATTVDRLLPKC